MKSPRTASSRVSPLKLPAFFDVARRRWRRASETDPTRYQAGVDALLVLQKEYEASDHYNHYQQVAELRHQLSLAATELCQERQLAIRRTRELAQLPKQLARIAQLEHDLAQRERQEADRLAQWLEMGQAPGLFATQVLPQLVARLSERQHRLAQRRQVLNVKRGLVGAGRGRPGPHRLSVP